VQDRTKDSGGTINRLAWGVGEFYNNVSYAIPVRLTDETIGESIRDNVLDTLSKFIPNPKIKSIREQIDVDAFIANHVYDSPNPSEGRWYFKDFYSKGKPSYPHRTCCSARVVNPYPHHDVQTLHVSMQNRPYLHLQLYPVRCFPFRIT
jgi:hypothetical protein